MFTALTLVALFTVATAVALVARRLRVPYTVALVVAGLVEGFLTPAGTGLPTVLAVGLSLGAIYWGLVLWRGAPEVPTGAPAI